MMNLPNDILIKIYLDSIILLKYNLGWCNVHKNIKDKNNKKKYIISDTGEILNPNWRKYSVNDIYSMDEYGNYLDDVWINDWVHEYIYW